MRIGFVGLGNMGHVMAANLQATGHDLTVNDLRPDRAAELIADGATWADSARATADGVEAVFLSLPAPPDVEAVVSGADGLLDGMVAGSTIVDLSTNSPSM